MALTCDRCGKEMPHDQNFGAEPMLALARKQGFNKTKYRFCNDCDKILNRMISVARKPHEDAARDAMYQATAMWLETVDG